MIDFERVPLWAMAVSMLVLAALGAGGMSALMRTRALRLWAAAWVPVGGVLFIALGAALKRDSLYHAVLLYDDGMILVGCIALVLAPEERRLRREAARMGTAPAGLSPKVQRKAAWIGSAVLAVVLIGEYVIASHHRL